MNNNGLTVQKILSLREWCKSNLPTSDSLVAYDIILVVAVNHYANAPLTVKNLFTSTPHSYTAVRSHYNRLCKDMWITHKLSETDKRIKYVKASDKLICAINEYVSVINEVFTPPLLQAES